MITNIQKMEGCPVKKLICLALAVLMVLSLCACGGGGGEKTEKAGSFRVGYGRADMTPNIPMPLGGYGQSEKRIHTEVEEPLMATCVAITDEEDETVLLFSLDVINSKYAVKMRAEVETQTGIPQDHMFMAATHTHSAPDQNQGQAGAFIALMQAAIVESAKAALEDRSEAEIYIGSTETEGLNFIRHYLMNDGTVYGNNFGSSASGIKAHAAPNDPELQVIKFVRNAEDKKDIIMANWQAHPCKTGGIDKTVMSSDFIGSTRRYVELQTKQHFIYFTGAAGNHNAKTELPGEKQAPSNNQEFGIALGTDVLEAMENMTKLEPGLVSATEYKYTGKVDHTRDHLVPEAIQVKALYESTDRATGNKLARELGLTSVYDASGVLTKSGLPETRDMNIYAISVGQLGFIGAPYEMFAAHGMYIKENSPAAMTFVCSCCNGANSYVPTKEAFDYICYESTIGYYVGEAGDELAQHFVRLLEEHRAA